MNHYEGHSSMDAGIIWNRWQDKMSEQREDNKKPQSIEQIARNRQKTADNEYRASDELCRRLKGPKGLKGE